MLKTVRVCTESCVSHARARQTKRFLLLFQLSDKISFVHSQITFSVISNVKLHFAKYCRCLLEISDKQQ